MIFVRYEILVGVAGGVFLSLLLVFAFSAAVSDTLAIAVILSIQDGCLLFLLFIFVNFLVLVAIGCCADAPLLHFW